nr:hypothetical protein [Tanacetum cinerariifolium]
KGQAEMLTEGIQRRSKQCSFNNFKPIMSLMAYGLSQMQFSWGLKKSNQRAFMFLEDGHICSNVFDEKTYWTHMFLEGCIYVL